MYSCLVPDHSDRASQALGDGAGAIRWAALFEEDREGNQCEFMETLRAQHVQEREEYMHAIEEALKEQYKLKVVQNPDDYGKISVVDARNAFAAVCCLSLQKLLSLACLP